MSKTTIKYGKYYPYIQVFLLKVICEKTRERKGMYDDGCDVGMVEVKLYRLTAPHT